MWICRRALDSSQEPGVPVRVALAGGHNEIIFTGLELSRFSEQAQQTLPTRSSQKEGRCTPPRCR